MGPFGWPGTCLVTTSRHPDADQLHEAFRFASAVSGALTQRDEKPLSSLAVEAGDLPVVVVEQKRVVCYSGGEAFFFHPGLIRMRSNGGGRGRIDPLIEALGLGHGDQVLDCTLGRAGDALLISKVVGATGRVVGLEASPVVAELVRIGLQSYTSFSDEIDAAMRRIQVAHADHREYLSGAADQSFDQVYFDPMFDQPLKRSRHIDSLRPLACADPLTPEAMQEARRVARRRVVIKSRAGSDTLEQLGVTRFSGGRWSAIVYGIIPVG